MARLGHVQLKSGHSGRRGRGAGEGAPTIEGQITVNRKRECLSNALSEGIRFWLDRIRAICPYGLCGFHENIGRFDPAKRAVRHPLGAGIGFLFV